MNTTCLVNPIASGRIHSTRITESKNSYLFKHFFLFTKRMSDIRGPSRKPWINGRIENLVVDGGISAGSFNAQRSEERRVGKEC